MAWGPCCGVSHEEHLAQDWECANCRGCYRHYYLS